MKKKEIELKFLITEDELAKVKPFVHSHICIEQGYVGIAFNVRVRIATSEDGVSALLTLKGERENTSRDEFEYEIPVEEAREMLDKLCYSKIKKTRYISFNGKDKWEIDVFGGLNSGLIVAELEIPYDDYDVQPPQWIIDDWIPVHDDDRYYNNYLSRHPFQTWPENMDKEHEDE